MKILTKAYILSLIEEHKNKGMVTTLTYSVSVGGYISKYVYYINNFIINKLINEKQIVVNSNEGKHLMTFSYEDINQSIH